MEFLEFEFYDFRDCRDGEVIVCRVVGDIPESVEDGTKDFGFETLDALDVGWLGSTLRGLEDGFINSFVRKAKFWIYSVIGAV